MIERLERYEASRPAPSPNFRRANLTEVQKELVDRVVREVVDRALALFNDENPNDEEPDSR